MKTITQTSGFSLDRFLQLCKRFIAINQRTWAISFAGALGLILTVWLLSTNSGASKYLVQIITINLATFLFLLGGLIITSSMFNELNNTGSASQMFTLPATTFEKLLATWFLSYFCYTIIGVVIIYLIIMFLGYSTMIPEYFDQATTIADKPGELVGSSILSYTTYHSIFLLGAVYFRKNNFIKTALSIILFSLSIGIIFILIFLLLGTDSWYSILYAESIFGIKAGSAWMFRVTSSIAITVLFLFLSYIRLKNRQVA